MGENSAAKGFGSIVRAVRRHLQLSQEALALNSAISKRTIETVESGKAEPRPNTITALSRALRADESALFAFENNQCVLVVRLIAAMQSGDFHDILEMSDHANVLIPEIEQIGVEATARDAGRLFAQLIDTYPDVSLVDRAIYLRDLTDLVSSMRNEGWIVRCGYYRRMVSTDAKAETVSVFRIFPVSCDGSTAFIPAAPDLSYGGAHIVWSKALN